MVTSSPERIKANVEQGLWLNKTLHQLLAEQLDEHAQMLMVKDQSNRGELTQGKASSLTYQELDNASTNMACQLLAKGVGHADVVIVQLPNIVELYVSYLAISKIGAIATPVPIQYSEHELLFVQGLTNAQAMISIKNFKDLALANNARSYLPNISVYEFYAADEKSNLSLELAVKKESINTLASHEKKFPSDANKIFTIGWTSGTTGTPKGVPRSHNMWVAVAESSIEAGGYDYGNRLLNPFPLVNMASIPTNLYAPLITACSVILHHPIDVELMLKQIQYEKVNFALVPPALLNQLAKSQYMWQSYDFSELKGGGSGSAPLAPSMIGVFENIYNKFVINCYGSNEGISFFSTPKIATDPTMRASMFARLGHPDIEWGMHCDNLIKSKLIDTQTGEEVKEVGVPGELVIRGATVFDGYLGADDVAVYTQDGYFRTGDLLEICGDPPRYYKIVGRCKDIINRGGMKISPSELDVLLEGIDGVREAAVCAYDDERMGEKICVCLVVDEEVIAQGLGTQEASINLQTVIDYLNQHNVAKFKLPERVEYFDALPRNPVGKIQRFILQETVSKRLLSS